MGKPTSTVDAEHRFDLDGLRGLAILLVLCSHVWWGRVSGGVDCFLVMSGYFLAVSTSRRGLPARWGDAARRVWRQSLHFVRRLSPAAALVLLGTLAMAFRIEPPSRWAELSRQVLASLFGYQNWHLASTDQAYARASGAVSPVQQFWSLSVQFQVYVVATAAVLALAFLARRARRPRVVVAAGAGLIAASSFGYALHAVAVDQDHAYYDSAARGWEFLLGVVVGLVVPMFARKTTPSRTLLRSALGTGALAGLAGTAFLVDGRHQFPGVTTLLPVAATLALLIVGGGGAGVLSNRILATVPLRALGDISYPLYLWHWPILIMSLGATGRSHAGWLLGSAVVVVSTLLAWLTHMLVEGPLLAVGRLSLPQVSRRVGMLALTTTTALLPLIWLAHTATLAEPGLRADLAAATVSSASGAASASTQWAVVPAPEVASDDGPGTPDNCATSPTSQTLLTCTFGDPSGSRTLVAVGGSHVQMFMPALDEIGKRHGIRIVSMVKVACPWSLALRKVGWNQLVRSSCLAWGDKATEAILALHPDLVLTTGTRPRLHRPGDRIPPRYPDRWWTLDRAGIPMVLLRDVPWLPQDVPDCVSSREDEPLSQVVEECGAPTSSVLSADPVGDFPGPLPPTVAWIDLTSVICPADRCLPVVGNVLVYRNATHLTTTFVMAIEPLLERRLATTTGWWSTS